MGKYIKLFETHDDYLDFTETEDFVLPNVSYCEDRIDEVHYNPLVVVEPLIVVYNVYDETYQDWICNSSEYEDVHQYMRARFSPERQYLLESARGLVDFIQHGIPAAYYEWNTVAQLKELFQTQPIYTNDISPARITTTAAYKAAYPAYLETRRYGKNQVWQYKLSPVS